MQHFIRVPAQQSLLISPSPCFAFSLTMYGTMSAASSLRPVAFSDCLFIPHYSLNNSFKHHTKCLKPQDSVTVALGQHHMVFDHTKSHCKILAEWVPWLMCRQIKHCRHSCILMQPSCLYCYSTKQPHKLKRTLT